MLLLEYIETQEKVEMKKLSASFILLSFYYEKRSRCWMNQIRFPGKLTSGRKVRVRRFVAKQILLRRKKKNGKKKEEV